MSSRKASSIESAASRFWSRVQKSAEPDGCWLWTGSTRNGYGTFLIAARPTYTHQFSYELHFAPIPDGKVVRHRCDVRRCVRPSHLLVGTQGDNIADMWERGRAVKPPVRYGESHPMARLSDEQVASIRQRWVGGLANQHALAADFGVSQSTVWRLVHGVVRV